MNGGVIVLVKDLAWVGATTQTWNTDWVSFPAGFQNAQLVVLVKSIVGGSLAVQLETTWDTDTATDAGSAVTANAVGTNVQDITTGLGPMVRLNFVATGTTQLVLSAYLTPKSE
jgi:hypothetical protein